MLLSVAPRPRDKPCHCLRSDQFPQGAPGLPHAPGHPLSSVVDEEQLDTLVCDGKTLRGSIAENASGAVRFIAQVSLYSQTLGVAIAQTTDATDAGDEIQSLRQ
jgi:hypothetical protein